MWLWILGTLPPDWGDANIKYYAKYGILPQTHGNIIITLVDALAHLQWVGFSFFDRNYFNLVVILFLCSVRKVMKTTHKNSSIIILDISLTGLFWVPVSVLITLLFRIVLPVAGIIICILQMGKLRLCLCCKVEYIIHGSVPIILLRDSRLEIFVQLKQKTFEKSLLIELMP